MHKLLTVFNWIELCYRVFVRAYICFGKGAGWSVSRRHELSHSWAVQVGVRATELRETVREWLKLE